MAITITSLDNINVEIRNVNYTKKILDLAYQNRDNISKEQFFKIITQLKNASSLWITKYDNMIKDFNKIQDENYNQGSQKGGENAKTTDTELLKMQHLYSTKSDQILSHLKSGYAIIHKLRDFITGEEILYRILDKDKNNRYFEGTINLDGLLSMVTLSKEKVLKQEREDYNKIVNFKLSVSRHLKSVDDKDILDIVEFKTNLYSQLEELYLDKTQNFNRGHVYEMYTYLVNEKNFNPGKKVKNINSPKPRILMDAAKSNSLRGTKGFKGGDSAVKYKDKVIDVQLKNISHAGAGLVNGLTIKKTMLNLLKEKDLTIEGLQKFFLKEFTQQIEDNEGIITHNLDREVSNRVSQSIKEFFHRLI